MQYAFFFFFFFLSSLIFCGMFASIASREWKAKKTSRNGWTANCIERNGNWSSRAQRKTFSSDWKTEREWFVERNVNNATVGVFFLVLFFCCFFVNSKEEKQHTVKGKITEKQQQNNNNITKRAAWWREVFDDDLERKYALYILSPSTITRNLNCLERNSGLAAFAVVITRERDKKVV